MKPRRTVSSNSVLSLEGGNEDNDLWCTVSKAEDQTPVICSTWELDAEEREKIAAGENVELVVFGTAHPPVMVRVTNVPIGARVNRKEIVERLRGMGNDKLADLFEQKSGAELEAEVKTWDLPEHLRGEVLAFVKLLEGAEDPGLDRDAGGVSPELDDPDWPYDDDPPDPL